MSIIHFIEPMLLLQTEKLPEGAAWLHEVKLDGYRAIAGRSGNSILFRSRQDNDFTRKFQLIAKAFRGLPDETLVDGEVAALDEQGSRPSISSRITNPHGACLFRVRSLDIQGRELAQRAAR